MRAGRHLTFFTGPHCGLCEQALDLLASCLRASDQLDRVDVTSSLELKKRYGLKIPVLRCEGTGAELFWPFDHAELIHFLGDPQGD